TYNGGIITPGINVSMDALYRHAAKLPKIEIAKPSNVIGQSTEGAMQSGVYYGYVGQVDGIVAKMKLEANEEPTVIATGGLAPLIAAGSSTIHHVETYLRSEERRVGKECILWIQEKTAYEIET